MEIKRWPNGSVLCILFLKSMLAYMVLILAVLVVGAVVLDALHRRTIDLCCAQETRRKGGSVRMLGAIGRIYKLFWQCCNKGTAGVGVFIAERWIATVVDVVRVNELIMYVNLVIGKQIVNIVSAYALQMGLSAEEKDDLWDSFVIVLSGIPKQHFHW